MQITSQYDGTVFWRVFTDYEPYNGVGLKDGTLEKGKSAEYNDGQFVQLEFKKGWFWGEIIKKATLFFVPGNVELRRDGSTYERPKEWSLQPTEYTNWMNDDVIQNRTLFEITLPKTHDSGAWQLSRCFVKDSKGGLPDEVPDAVLTAAPFIPTFPIVVETIRRMSLAQSRSVAEQLNEGIRVLDLRAVYCSDFERFHTAHGLIGTPISYILEEIKQFLDRTAREIVVVELGTGSSTNNSNWPKLRDSIKGMFGDRLVPKEIDLQTTKLGDLTKGVGSRLIIVSSQRRLQK
jgi:hypothetical protein